MSPSRHRRLIAACVLATVLFAPPLLAVMTPQDVRIPQLAPRKLPPPALFSHWRHNTQHCYACHPSMFPQAPVGFTHQQMEQGLFCGACHDGRAATGVTAMRCEACHVAR